MKYEFGAGPQPNTQAKFGIEQLDRVLNGLHWGENVVWLLTPDVNDAALTIEVLRAASENSHDGELLYIASNPIARDAAQGFGYQLVDIPQTVERTDLTASKEIPPPKVLAIDLAAPVRHDMAQLTEIARGVLLNGAVAHWFVSNSASADEWEPILELAQIILRLTPGHIDIKRADARGPGIVGTSLKLNTDSTSALSIVPATAASRLGRGLAAIRHERGWSQSELAQVAGVSPSAISQAENGRHALSLETLLDLSSKLGISLDRIVEGRRQNYDLRRSDRRASAFHYIEPLIDDHELHARAMVVHLPPLGTISPMSIAESGTLLMVGAGLVQVSVGNDRPVLRAGDALSTPSGVNNLRNLTDQPSIVFIVVSRSRDLPPR